MEKSEMSRIELEQFESGEAAYHAVSKALNTMSDIPVEGFVEAALREHRTVKQSFMGAILTFVVRYSEDDFDARNEASVKAAREIRELLGNGWYLNREQQRVAFPFI